MQSHGVVVDELVVLGSRNRRVEIDHRSTQKISDSRGWFAKEYTSNKEDRARDDKATGLWGHDHKHQEPIRVACFTGRLAKTLHFICMPWRLFQECRHLVILLTPPTNQVL
jgi:hypothetical protein